MQTAGVFRSDDSGETWTRVNSDPRVLARPYDATDVRVHPTNPDIVIVPTIVTWKSTDGGRTFTAIRGAPGGDDYQRAWFNPNHSDIIALTSDQGAVISLNGGESWSSWYNQATAAFYHVSTDNAFPYRVCGGQQESGSACVQSRGDHGQITFREWSPVGVEEYGYVAPDPLNPDLVYGGKVSRWNRKTRQVQNITPKLFRAPDFRVVRTMPVMFSPADNTTLYFASNTVWKTLNGGTSWTQISRDLTRSDSSVPPNVGKYSASARGRHPGVIYTLAPSPLGTQVLWAGSDDGLIHVTMNGGTTWRDVTPPDVRATPWAKISLMDASHFDANTAYAAVNTLRLDDLRPHIFRTHDAGKTWTRIVNGIADGATVNVVREDPKRRGLLYAGTERDVWFSIDDGDHWQPLRLNMPATSIRDLWVKDDDLIAGTHGRSFWILDDVTPLRQITTETARRPVVLHRPQMAMRWRWNTNTDTPLPQEEPAGQNPPDGAIINLSIAAGTSSALARLEILDSTGAVVRRYANTDTAMALMDIGNVPAYWIRPTQTLKAVPGTMERFVWDLRWTSPAALQTAYPIAAIYRNTAREPRGPAVQPGRYTVRLTYGSEVLTQPMVVRMDPRVKTPPAQLAQQLALSLQLARGMTSTYEAANSARDLRARIRTARERTTGGLAASLDSLDARVALIHTTGVSLDASSAATTSLTRLHGDLAQLYTIVQGADVAPATQVVAAIAEREALRQPLLTRWMQLRAAAMEVDRHVRAAGLPFIMEQ